MKINLIIQQTQPQAAIATYTLKNKQYYVGESAKNIKQFITNPEKQKQALEDLIKIELDKIKKLKSNI